MGHLVQCTAACGICGAQAVSGGRIYRHFTAQIIIHYSLRDRHTLTVIIHQQCICTSVVLSIIISMMAQQNIYRGI